MGHGESAETIFSNLQQLSNLAVDKSTIEHGLLNIGIPDSAYLNRDSDARSRRDQINGMLKKRNKAKLHYIPCPFKYSRTSKNYETDGLHFSEIGYSNFADGILNLVYDLLS